MVPTMSMDTDAEAEAVLESVAISVAVDVRVLYFYCAFDAFWNGDTTMVLEFKVDCDVDDVGETDG